VVIALSLTTNCHDCFPAAPNAVLYNVEVTCFGKFRWSAYWNALRCSFITRCFRMRMVLRRTVYLFLLFAVCIVSKYVKLNKHATISCLHWNSENTLVFPLGILKNFHWQTLRSLRTSRTITLGRFALSRSNDKTWNFKIKLQSDLVTIP